MRHINPDRYANFMPSNELFVNPHKGFVTFNRFNGDRLNEGVHTENWTVESGWKMEDIPPQDGLFEGDVPNFPKTSIAYFRVPWRRLEPEEGNIRFDLLDDILDTAWERGQHTMLRLVAHTNRPEVDLPDWLREKLGLPLREPGFKESPRDPLYYSSYERLIRAVGAHLDGDRRLDSLDMALVGAWGEGHNVELLPVGEWSPLVDAYMEAFPTTPIMAQFNSGESIRLANAYRPVGVRCDCLGNMTWHMYSAYPQRFASMPDLWKKAPVGFEICWIMKHWMNMGWDLDYIIEQSLKWHISTFNAKSCYVPPEWEGQVNEWIKKMGYRFALRQVCYPSAAEAGDVLHLRMWMENRGAAPIYRRYPLMLRLTGENGAKLDFKAEADVTEWLPGDHILEETLALPENLAAGNYRLSAGVTDGETLIRLATDAPVEDGFVTVGSIAVRG